MTLDDLEQPKRTCRKNVLRCYCPPKKIWMKIDDHYQRQKCS